MQLIGTIFLFIGLLSLLYYGTIVSYAGIHSSFAEFWILTGIGCILLFVAIRFLIKYEIELPRLLKHMAMAVMILGITVFVIMESFIVIYGNHKADQDMDYLIVLGAQIRGTTVTKSLKERLDSAVGYLNENPETMVIVTGGQGKGETITEAQAMAEYLVNHGIKKDRMIKEEKATNTNENIRYSKEIIGDMNAKVAIVTNGFHVFRSVGIAKKQGFLNVQGNAAPSDRILLVNYYVREMFGVLKDKFVGNL